MGFRIRHKITGLLAVLVILSGPAVLTAEAQENIPAIQFPYPFPMTLLAPASDTVNICIIGDISTYSPQKVTELWLNSQSHKDVLLREYWQKTGISVFFNNGKVYCVQIFVC